MILKKYNSSDANLDIIETEDKEEIKERFLNHLSDESKARTNDVRKISFPRNVDELSYILANNFNNNIPSRLSAGRTGVTAASVPNNDDCLISFDKMKSIVISANEKEVRVEAGVTLAELNNKLNEVNSNYYFPIDPTETSAAISGLVSNNASGARSYFYGSIRNWVIGLKLVLSNGSILEVTRGEDKISENKLNFVDNKTFEFKYDILKPKTKNTLGYYYSPPYDLIDLFIGQEGTLAAIAEITLKLEPIIKQKLYYLQFFPSDESALNFIEELRANNSLKILAIEYLDYNSLQYALLSPVVKSSPLSQVITKDVVAAIYIEFIAEDDNQIEFCFQVIEDILSKNKVNSDLSYAGIEDKIINNLKILRHAVPEQINSIIAKRKSAIPQLHKVATDMAVPKDKLKEIYFYYKNTLEQAAYEYAIFGHAGDAHFHVNLLPRTADELQKIKELYFQFAKKVISLGGAVSAEHGIGRLKREFLKLQYNQSELENMKEIKLYFDPKNLLNRGVIFDE